MKKYKPLFFALLFMLLLGACSSSETDSAWQEQYDLGMEYLNREKYDEAILAFQAAIEIDPDRDEAYSGLEDARTAADELQSDKKTEGQEIIGTASENENKPIESTDTSEENGGANIEECLAQAQIQIDSGDLNAAISTLENGYEKTGDAGILKQLCDTRLDDQLNILIDQYGIASTKEKSYLVVDFSDGGWTDLDGIISAGKFDLDGDGYNELILVRAAPEAGYWGDKNIKLFVDVYYADPTGVGLSGSICEESYDDTGDVYLVFYVYDFGQEKYIILENCSNGSLVDSWFRDYTAIRYSNKAIYKTMKIEQSAGGTSDIAESMYLYDEDGNETETVLKADGFAVEEKGSEGKYAGSDNIYRDALMDFGFEYPPEFMNESFPTYFNSPHSQRLCKLYSSTEFFVSDRFTGYLDTVCGAEDYTGLQKLREEAQIGQDDGGAEQISSDVNDLLIQYCQILLDTYTASDGSTGKFAGALIADSASDKPFLIVRYENWENLGSPGLFYEVWIIYGVENGAVIELYRDENYASTRRTIQPVYSSNFGFGLMEEQIISGTEDGCEDLILLYSSSEPTSELTYDDFDGRITFSDDVNVLRTWSDGDSHYNVALR